MTASPANRASEFFCLAALTRILNVAVLLLDADGDLDFANAAACTLLDSRDEKVLKENWRAIKLRLFATVLSQMPQDDRPVHFSIALPQGNTLRLEIFRVSEADWWGYLLLLKDPRRVDVLEENLVEASQMRALMRRYPQIAHDLRAPVNTMALSLELLKRSLPPLSHPEQQGEQPLDPERYVTTLAKELPQLNRMLRDVFNEYHPLTAIPAKFDLREVLLRVINWLMPLAVQQKIELKTELPKEAVWLDGFQDRMEQALFNLVVNAVEAMPRSGNFAAGLSEREANAVITLEDNGPGLSPEVADEIFNLHFTTSKSSSGTNLYTARLVIESHGGELHIENRVDGGMRTTVVLPLIGAGAP